MQLCGRGHSLYIPEETSMLAAYSCMMTCRHIYRQGIWNLESVVTIHINKTEGFVCSHMLAQNAHVPTLLFYGTKCRRVDRFIDFTQLLREPSIDHRGYPFLKDFAFTPERLTSKVGHGVLKNFIFDRQPGDVS